MLSLLAISFLAGAAHAQVTATGTNGVTNPPAPSFMPVGSYVNQSSYSRLTTINGVDDFCLYGPPDPGPDSLIGNVEPFVVAYCTKPRNQARLIPDGTIQSAHFVRTPLYVQVWGMWDGTRVNIPFGDSGGELDPHGPDAVGNPIGGNVTSDVPTGGNVFYEEWMSFISYDQYCLRVCTAQNANITTALQCEHELDIMGCQFVMAIGDFYDPTKNGTFTSCDGDAAAAPGLYVQPGGSTSTFRQRYTGTYTNDGVVGYWTIGQTVTPSAPAFYPSSSNCFTYSTISNGVNTANWQVTAAPSTLNSGSTVAVGNVASTSMSRPSGLPSASAGGSGSGSAASGASRSGSASGSGASTARPSGASGSVSAGAGAQSPSSAGNRRAEFSLPGMTTVLAMLGAGAFGAAAVLL